MGFLRKVSGVQSQIDATNRNADAQIEATQKAAEMNQQQLAETARAAAEQQSMMAARNAAMDKAKDAVSVPTESVQVDLAATETPGTRRNRRAQFGRGNTGVSI